MRPAESAFMSDKFVTVQRFNNSFKAQLAKNLLENEGIESIISGELAQDVMLGTGLSQIALQVHEDEAQRATGILAAVEAEAELDDNWEEQAESGVWLCSICGEPVSNLLSVCYACETPRESIRAGEPREPTAIQPDPATLPSGEKVQSRDETVRAPAHAPLLPAPSPPAAEPDEEREEALPTAAGDELARRAFLASLIGLPLPFLLPVSWYYLLRVVVFSGELSAKGVRCQYGALLVNGFVVFLILVLCTGRMI
jgi:hypothetical protein